MPNTLSTNKIIKISDFTFNEKFIRAKELAKIFINTAQSTFDNWAKAGLIGRYKINGGVYYKLSEIEKLIEEAKEIL